MLLDYGRNKLRMKEMNKYLQKKGLAVPMQGKMKRATEGREVL